MGRVVDWLDDRVESFIGAYWDTDVRGVLERTAAAEDMARNGIAGAVAQFLEDVVRRDAVTPRQWSEICNVQAESTREVRADAALLRDWLFGDGQSGGR